ncbi:MAG: hypothetical protein ACOCXJ_01555 [Planctomycetota bacterium]
MSRVLCCLLLGCTLLAAQERIYLVDELLAPAVPLAEQLLADAGDHVIHDPAAPVPADAGTLLVELRGHLDGISPAAETDRLAQLLGQAPQARLYVLSTWVAPERYWSDSYGQPIWDAHAWSDALHTVITKHHRVVLTTLRERMPGRDIRLIPIARGFLEVHEASMRLGDASPFYRANELLIDYGMGIQAERSGLYLAACTIAAALGAEVEQAPAQPEITAPHLDPSTAIADLSPEQAQLLRNIARKVTSSD